MGQIEKNIAGLEPPAVEGLTRAPFPPEDDLMRFCLFVVFFMGQIRHLVSASHVSNSGNSSLGKLDKMTMLSSTI